MWKTGIVLNLWGMADGLYEPKEENSRGITMHYPISLLDVDAKIMFGILASRLSAFLLQNGFINRKQQYQVSQDVLNIV